METRFELEMSQIDAQFGILKNRVNSTEKNIVDQKKQHTDLIKKVYLLSGIHCTSNMENNQYKIGKLIVTKINHQTIINNLSYFLKQYKNHTPIIFPSVVRSGVTPTKSP